MFTFADVFAVIGGFRLAAEEVDGRCIFASEIKESALKYIKIFVIFCVLIPTVPASAYISYEERILVFYDDVVKQTQDHGLSGPIAAEVAQFALLRRIHEDGLTRSIYVSMNGMVPGQPNKSVVKQLDLGECELDVITAKDGQGCYVIRGRHANVLGAVAIALWYDKIINSTRFRICNKEERKIWNDSRHYSHMIAIGRKHPKYKIRFRRLKPERLRILKKVNRAYGPRGKAINQKREKLKSLFSFAWR